MYYTTQTKAIRKMAVFIHIAASDADKAHKIKQFNAHIKDGKHAFTLFYLDGCGPCNAARPEWNKIRNAMSDEHKHNRDILVAEIDQATLNDGIVHNSGDIEGFPTIRYIVKGKKRDEYEGDRTMESFTRWMDKQIAGAGIVRGGGKSKTKKMRVDKNSATARNRRRMKRPSVTARNRRARGKNKKAKRHKTTRRTKAV